MRDLRVLISRPNQNSMEWETQVSWEFYHMLLCGDEVVKSQAKSQLCDAARIFAGIPYDSRCHFTIFV